MEHNGNENFFNDIAPYNIQVAGMQLTVLPLEDGAYRICHQQRVLADLYPEITAAGIYWNGFGLLPLWFAEEIGQQIYTCEI